MAVSATHNGWRYDPSNSRLDFYYRGTRAGDIDATGVAVTGTLEVTGATTVTGNLTISSTLTAGADGVGADGEQLTSGGAAAECDWSAAGSMRQFKNILGIRTDDDKALEDMVNTPIYDFQYRSKKDAKPGERIINTGDTQTVYTGIMADEAPWAMHFGGKILNPINTFGKTVQAIRALAKRVEALEATRA